MEAARYPHQRQHCRVSFPVLVSFSSDSLSVRQFTLNLSEGGIFLPTEKSCPLGTRGMPKFRTSQFEDPFSLEAEVVRIVPPGDESGDQAAGLGMRFVDLNEKNRALLLKLINGASSGSIVQTIRNSLKEHGRTLGVELRKRPTDQKMMLAVQANAEEIQALLRDGNPSVIARLLECPRLTVAHVVTMLKNPNLPTRVLSSVKKDRKWISNQQVRYLFCTHNNAQISEAIEQLRMLPPDRLKAISREGRVRAQIKSKAADLSRQRGR